MPDRSHAFAAFFLASLCAAPASADDLPDWLSLHGQSTFIVQYHPSFRSPYRGANSMAPQSVGDETFDATLFIGVRLWNGGAVYFNPEIDQGFGLSNTLGSPAFPAARLTRSATPIPIFGRSGSIFSNPSILVAMRRRSPMG